MTLNEVFYKVWDHFVVKKNPKSTGYGGMCSYRGCAIGICLPVSFQQILVAQETKPTPPGNITSLSFEHPKEVAETFPNIDIRILSAIQDIHDRTHDVTNFHKEVERKLRNFAELFNICVPLMNGK